MMMAFGMFVFELETAPYQRFQQQMQWRHDAQNRVGARPARQFLGPGNDTVTLAGALYPQFTGGVFDLDQLRNIADQAKAWPLIEGTGVNYGVYVITGLTANKTHFDRDGYANKIDFTLNLARVDNDNRDAMGVIAPADVGAMLGRRIGNTLGGAVRDWLA